MSTASQTIPLNDRELEQLIYDIAEHARDEDYDQLYETLVETKLFVPVDQASLASSSDRTPLGKVIQVDASTLLQIREAEGPREDLFMPVATNESSPLLAQGYVEMPWLEALKKSLTVESIAGIKLQGENSWICFYKPQIERVLSSYS